VQVVIEQATIEQEAMLTHVNNVFHIVPQVKLAKHLVESSFADRVFLQTLVLKLMK
jgi:acetylornithine aminotransferase